jgi:hypothetical protein
MTVNRVGNKTVLSLTVVFACLFLDRGSRAWGESIRYCDPSRPVDSLLAIDPDGALYAWPRTVGVSSAPLDLEAGEQDQPSTEEPVQVQAERFWEVIGFQLLGPTGGMGSAGAGRAGSGGQLDSFYCRTEILRSELVVFTGFANTLLPSSPCISGLFRPPRFIS